MTATYPTAIKGDRALRSGDEDKLGFRDIAARLATSLVDHASDDGLIVGVEGTWGSGKSSLLFLIEEELIKLPKNQRPSVVNFRPWLVGNRDALLVNLFASLTKTIDQVALEAGDASRISATKAKVAAEALRKFVAALGKTGSVFEVAGDAVGFAPLKWAGSGLKALREWTKDKPVEPSLSELKDKLVSSLRQLGHRFIITIDDVDRLEPTEVIEVLRLARSVADFPNVIYLLCYDSEILSHSIEQAAKVKSGRAYLEKIVQLTVMVPKPEPFQLRKWFSEELHSIAGTKNDDELSRLKSVVDYEGGQQLASPRSVVRTLDSIRFFWPPLRDARADLADLVWLQLIKEGNPSLFRWIERYCATAALLSLGTARVEDVERANDLAALEKTVEANHFEDHNYRYYFSQQLPGLESNFSEDGERFKLYQRVSEEVRNAAIENGRLASPDHYRLYFALAGPSHALTQENFDAIRSATEAGADETEAVLLKWHSEDVAGALGKTDMLFERIRGGTQELLTSTQCINLLLATSDAMDKTYRIRAFDFSWVGSLWDKAERLMPVLLSRLSVDERTSTLEVMFRDGNAISWLTTLLRRETFAHGRYGARTLPEGDWIFTNPELDRITEIMISRYRSMSAVEIFAVIDPVTLLFAWQQGGDEDGPRHLVESRISTDEGLVETLEYLTSTITSSSRGAFPALKRDYLTPFLDYDHVRERIRGLQSGALAERAHSLVRAFDDGAKY
jgi:hypothetical protein